VNDTIQTSAILQLVEKRISNCEENARSATPFKGPSDSLAIVEPGTIRGDSLWDDVERRPSHADRRKALQTACLAEEFSQHAPHATLPRKFRTLLKRLLRIAV
jgi:hypothetical protein